MLDIDQYALSYDLVSFTSNLSFQRDFLQELVWYCTGVQVQVVGACEGIVTKYLGQLILQYTDQNLHCILYRSNLQYLVKNTDYVHNRAGYLGVYGNISSATFQHGAIVLQSVMDTVSLNVCGDDGLIVTKDHIKNIEAIKHVGLISEEKLFVTFESGCIHLKLGIQSTFPNITLKRISLWPHLEYPYQSKTDIRFTHLSHYTNAESSDAVAGAIKAFLKSSKFLSINKVELRMIHKYLLYVYGKYHSLIDGHVPQLSDKTDHGFVPTIHIDSIGQDQVVSTINRHYSGRCTLRLRENITLLLPPEAATGMLVMLTRALGIVWLISNFRAMH